MIQLWEDVAAAVYLNFTVSSAICQQTHGKATFRNVALRQEGMCCFRNVSLPHQTLADQQRPDTYLSEA